MKYYKLAMPSGYDFYTGKTINYRDNIGKTVRPPNANRSGGLCSSSFIHAADAPNKCFIGAHIPCSAYIVHGDPVICDDEKCGFVELEVLSEVSDLDVLFGWNYSEACNPIHALHLPAKRTMTVERMALLGEWASVRASVGASVRASVGASVWDTVGDTVWDTVWDTVGASVRASVRASVWDTVRASVWDTVGDTVGASVWDTVGDTVWDTVGAYIGSLFPNTAEWLHVGHESGVYPFQPVVDLWKQGIVPSFDGKSWRLHSGRQAKIIWQGTLHRR